MIKGSYLENLKINKENKEINDCAKIGILGGCTLFLVSSWFTFFSSYIEHYYIWRILLVFSCIEVVVTLVIPQLLLYLFKALTNATNFVFNAVLKLLLMFIYIFIITPVAYLNEKILDLFFIKWDNAENLIVPDWAEKKFNFNINQISGKKDSRLIQYIKCLHFFIEKKEWFLFPTIIAILILALIFAFVQSSLTLPFIYTIF